MEDPEENINPMRKALGFFRDESIPMGARVGVAGGIALVLTFPIWADLSFKRKPVPGIISEVNFPKGPSGLADPESRNDVLRAEAALLLQKQNEAIARKKQAEMSMLEDIDPASEESRIKQDEQEEATAELAVKDRQVKRAKTANKPDSSVLPETKKIASKKEQSAFKLLPLNIRVGRGILEGKDGTLLLGYRSGIYSFVGGKLSNAKNILNSKIYDADYGVDMPEISRVAAASDGSIYAGFVDGQLMQYKNYEWKKLVQGPQGTGSKITSIVESDKKIFLGAKGLHQWDPELNQLFSNPNHQKAWIHALSSSPNSHLYMSSRRALWKYKNDEEDSWELLWVAPKSDIAIRAIHALSDDTFLLGTGAGIVRVSAKGVVLDRALENENVYSVSQGKNGTIWAGTRGSGLRYFDGSKWHRAGQAQGLSDWVPEVLVDSHGRIWLGATGIGTFVANEKKAAKWISKFPDKNTTSSKPQIFANACNAADTLLRDIALSNDIANVAFDGRGYVFLNGVQSCPRGIGRIMPDGTKAFLNGWNLTLLKDTKRQEIVVSDSIAADTATVIFVDAKQRTWLATEAGELHVYEGDSWSKITEPGLVENPITSIVQDKDSNLWFASNPPFDQKAQTFHKKNLHKLENEVWSHFDSRDGLLQNSSLAMSYGASSGKLAIGTRLGISVIQNKSSVINYGKDQGLDPVHVAGVTVDASGKVWFAHQFHGDGMGWIDGDTVRRVTSKQGLFNPKITSIAIDRNARVWLEASNGQVAVYPQSYLEDFSVQQPLRKEAIRERRLGDVPL